MTSDLIFSVLPRQGTTPVTGEEQKVQQVSKEASLRPLNDEEKELVADERDAREEQHPQKQQAKKKKKEQTAGKDGITVDAEGNLHLDIYV